VINSLAYAGRMQAVRIALVGALWFVSLACSRSEPAVVPERCDAALETIASGFGARGPHSVGVAALPNPRWPGQQVSLHFPEGVSVPVPVVFFGHGNDLGEPKFYTALIDHIASTGIAVVFSPYAIGNNIHVDRYDAIRSGVEAAVERWGDRLDLTRVGFVGHSYGAGALPWLAHHSLVARGWGSEGALLFSLAPWFSLAVSPDELRELPTQLRALFVVFEGDKVNDHRIAIAQYHRLAVPEGGKQYVLVRASENEGCKLPAPHTLPQSVGLRARDDALDERVLFRLFDALAAWTFTGDAAGRAVAFGNGSDEQVELGSWPDGTKLTPLEVRRHPKPTHESAHYLFLVDDRDGWIRYGEPSTAGISPGDAAPAP
jgi:hypothetical protein